MTNEKNVVRTTLRIPGNWPHPGEIVQRIPAGFQLTPEFLVLPDGAQIQFTPLPPDDQFPGIFRSMCRQPPTDDELEIVNSYTVNIGLTGPGGSMKAARTMLQAGAAIVRAGGAGVFIDNSAVVHGGQKWIEMADDGGPDAVSFAFAGIVRGRQDVWTVGMHVMGLPEIVMKRSDADADGDTIIEVIRYLCAGVKPIGDGHLIASEDGLRFRAVAIGGTAFEPGSPMYNPFGRLKLVSIKEITESN
jgi:hypothetical protein